MEIDLFNPLNLARRSTRSSAEKQPMNRPNQIFGWIALSTATLIMFVAALKTTLPTYWTWLLGLSLSAFFLYGYDKWAAPRNRLRAPEIVLLLMALAGGFPGAFAGQKLFRHKTRKKAFMLTNWIALITHGALLFRFPHLGLPIG